MTAMPCSSPSNHSGSHGGVLVVDVARRRCRWLGEPRAPARRSTTRPSIHPMYADRALPNGASHSGNAIAPVRRRVDVTQVQEGRRRPILVRGGTTPSPLSEQMDDLGEEIAGTVPIAEPSAIPAIGQLRVVRDREVDRSFLTGRGAARRSQDPSTRGDERLVGGLERRRLRAASAAKTRFPHRPRRPGRNGPGSRDVPRVTRTFVRIPPDARRRVPPFPAERRLGGVSASTSPRRKTWTTVARIEVQPQERAPHATRHRQTAIGGTFPSDTW